MTLEHSITRIWRIGLAAAVALVTAVGAEPLPELDCMVEPHVVVDVGSPDHGIVEKIEVERSDAVAAQDVLVRLESGEQTAAMRKARARAAMQSEIRAREAALAFAQRKQERMRDLYASDAISSHQRDEVETELKMAEMQLRQAREAQTLARIELERAEADLQRRTIRSPISGVVVERFVAPGEYVHEKPLLRVAQMNPLKVEAIAPAALFGKVTTGMQAEITAEAQPGRRHVAEVVIVDRLIDPASGTFGIRLELPNPEYAIPSGLNCRLRLLPQRRTAAEPAAAPPAPTVNPNQQTSAATPAVTATGWSRLKPVAPPAAAAAAAAPAETGIDTAAGAENCFSFGPLANPAAVDELLARLGDTSREVARRQRPADNPGGFFVLTEMQGSVEDARAYADTLRDKGIADLAVLTRQPHAGRVSLGLFDRHANAEVQQRKLAQLGIAAEIAPRRPATLQYWVDVEVAQQTIRGAAWPELTDAYAAGSCAEPDYVVADGGKGN